MQNITPQLVQTDHQSSVAGPETSRGKKNIMALCKATEKHYQLIMNTFHSCTKEVINFPFKIALPNYLFSLKNTVLALAFYPSATEAIIQGSGSTDNKTDASIPGVDKHAVSVGANGYIPDNPIIQKALIDQRNLNKIIEKPDYSGITGAKKIKRIDNPPYVVPFSRNINFSDNHHPQFRERKSKAAQRRKRHSGNDFQRNLPPLIKSTAGSDPGTSTINTKPIRYRKACRKQARTLCNFQQLHHSEAKKCRQKERAICQESYAVKNSNNEKGQNSLSKILATVSKKIHTCIRHISHGAGIFSQHNEEYSCEKLTINKGSCNILDHEKSDVEELLNKENPNQWFLIGVPFINNFMARESSSPECKPIVTPLAKKIAGIKTDHFTGNGKNLKDKLADSDGSILKGLGKLAKKLDFSQRFFDSFKGLFK